MVASGIRNANVLFLAHYDSATFKIQVQILREFQSCCWLIAGVNLMMMMMRVSSSVVS